MFSSTLRTGALRSVARRSLHTSAPRADAASTAAQTAERATKQLTGLAERAKSLSKPIADRASALAGEKATSFASRITSEAWYYARVGGNVAKQVYVADGLSPPSLHAVREVGDMLRQKVPDPSFWQGLLRSGQWQRVLLYAVEAYGIFHIGQMIGRFHLMGYKVNKHPLPDGAHH